MRARVFAFGLVAVALATGLAGCGDSKQRPESVSPADQATNPPATPGADTPFSGGPIAPPSTPSGATSRSATVPQSSECREQVLLDVAKRTLDNPAMGVSIEKVQIVGCRSGFSRLFAIPKQGPQPVEGDQLFLKYVSGKWQVIDRGAGIDCGDSSLKPDTAAACQALG